MGSFSTKPRKLTFNPKIVFEKQFYITSMNKNVRVVIVNYENKHNKIYLFDSEHNFFLSCNKYNHVLTSLLTHLNFETIAQRDIEYNLETRMKYQYVELN